MRILLASSEVHPWSKTGGLADMVGALGQALASLGNEVGIVTPLYRGIAKQWPALELMDYHLQLPLGHAQIRAQVWRLTPGERLTLYFIDRKEFYDRPGLYGERGADYSDNAERFIFFSKTVAHLARYLPARPDVVHLNDWQTGPVALLIHHDLLHGGWPPPHPRLCFTIHNLSYQGIFPRTAFGLFNLPWQYFNLHGVEFHGRLNCLKAGIVYAHVITTVSPRYAREIQTQEFGCGLDGLLQHRRAHLVGILNGGDGNEWRTENNPYLPYSYSARDLSGKRKIKLALQQELQLPSDLGIPLFGTVTRMAEQKGLDILRPALEEVLPHTPMQFVLLGNGMPALERVHVDLARRFPQQVAVRVGYDQALAHRIVAGSDFYLMPSRFEPCGLNQMFAQRYGTVPIVRRTGGLDDTVVDIWDDPDRASGIKFTEYTPAALARAIRKALVLFQHPRLMKKFQWNGMNADFSWERAARAYLEAYGHTPG